MSKELKFDGSMKFSICKWSADLLEIEHQYPWFEKLCLYDLSENVRAVPPADCPRWNPLEDWNQCMRVREKVCELWEASASRPGHKLDQQALVRELSLVLNLGFNQWNNGMVAKIAFATQNQILAACYQVWVQLQDPTTIDQEKTN